MINGNKKIGVHIPNILLPKSNVNLNNWAVVACDQYTSQPEYWTEVERQVGDCPSTLHLIFPEIYLEEENSTRIEKITASMQRYLQEGIVTEQKSGFIYIDRSTPHTSSREGLIVALDLELYDYNVGSQTLIRATEGTVLERIPPRIKIRENAPIELPHIMVLIDDPEKTVIEPVAKKASTLEALYDFDLMMQSGHIKGYRVDDQKMISDVLDALQKLSTPELFQEKYHVGPEKGILLFAVGDGNHSLATAKACWENIKKTISTQEWEDHPARFALVELVNVHSEGLTFESIHRVVFDIQPEQMLKNMIDYFKRESSSARYEMFDKESAMNERAKQCRENSSGHIIKFVTKEKWGVLIIEKPKYNLEVGTLQAFLDDYIKSNDNAKIDYIHGEDVVTTLGTQEGNMGFYLPPMDKQDLFKTVIVDGVLPRKTFSMGEAEEKRFYMECRKITK